MADALCGPSNALQSFQKHTSVDRTLQQDRLSSRQSPTQGFRSSLGPNAGALDPEFDAFQAGHTGPPQQAFQHFPPQFPQQHHQPPPTFAQSPAAPDWASDFQRLNIGPLHPAHTLHGQQPNVPAPNVAASWHQDFLNQPQPATQNQPYGGMPFGGMGAGMGAYTRPAYGGFGGGMQRPMGQEVRNGKQRAEEAIPKFDDAAFEAAFEQVQRDMMGEMEDREEQRGMSAADWAAEIKGKLQAQNLDIEEDRLNMIAADMQQREQTLISGGKSRFNDPGIDYQMQLLLLEQENKKRLLQARAEQNARQNDLDSLVETDPYLLRIREKRLSVYNTIKLRSQVDLGRLAEALPYLADLEDLESRGKLTADASEAKWCVDILQRIASREVPQEVKTRVENLIKAINERLMSSYPLLATGVPIHQDNIWEELRAAGYTREGIPGDSFPKYAHQEPEQKKEEQKKEERNHRNDEDEMAETAGRLLERVADNTSEKFQNSQFLELMRRLRDREVRVEGDKMVEVSAQPSVSPLPASAPPEIDPRILDHAAVDFSMPLDSEREFDLSSRSSLGPAIDEVSEQFSFYDTNSSYHR